MNQKWTGKIERPLRVWTNPRLSDDIYLHFSEILKKVKFYAQNIRGKVLDVGAGKTPYREFFSNVEEYVKLENFDYPGTDIKADVTKRIPVKNNSFDSVVCFQVLEHLNNPEKAISEIHRVLKRGGACLLTTHMAAPLHGVPYDYYRFTEFGLKDLFKKFSKAEVKPNGGSVLSIIQLVVWGVSEKFPSPIAKPLIFLLNIIGKDLDRVFYDTSFTLNYSVFAIK